MKTVEKKQPGWQLDGLWLVYAARETAPKLDTWLKHPSLPAGYFRSVRGMLIYLDALIAAVGNSSGGGRGAGYGAGYGLGSGYGDMDCLPAGQQLDVTVWRHPPIDREYEPPPKGCAVLVLGMVFASAAAAAAAHAGMAHHRDRARLMQLRAGLHYRPHSFDRDNTETCGHQGLHVQGNFNSTRGARDVTLKFPGVKFGAIFCDYFRMPTGYACEVYKPQLFTQFVPELVRRGAVSLGVPVYVPNNPVLLKSLAAAGARFATVVY
ncbi:hypothetical protein OEZ86_009583 [Tetradesmus obliquus]|uniref:Uncharacterized protein n=1 Tax=Tetradesmus obliquus TaxID=3088 RepID=A0ABY8UMM1_TETOB|nr:hypothetical protein OEZ85_001028 [Tetradesmus obliquus]WIA43054.1 hypothetical protein OEZ86_009583 [Tetradesmus obliquus]